MTKNKFNSKSKCLKLSALLLFPTTLFAGSILSTSALDKKAETLAETTRYVCNDKVNLENSSFEKGSGTYVSEASISNWSAIETKSKATGMIIDVGRGETSEGENKTFSDYQDTYMLSENPECKDGEDTKVLMINSKANINQSKVPAIKGFRSDAITLAANSYYSFKVSARAMKNNDDYVSASIYLSGLKDTNNKPKLIGIENITQNYWEDFYIFLATGEEAQTVYLDLYLGSCKEASGLPSQGAVFFDNCHVERYSENLFYDVVSNHGYSTTDEDNADSFNNKKVFYVKGLKTLKSYISNHSDYNFDFEDTSREWEVIKQANAFAKILDVSSAGESKFLSTTNFDSVGNDLSYENNNALVMWTGNSSSYSTSYVGVKSEDIEIKAHTAYKVSLKMKVSDSKLEEGSFYLKVSENENIYSLYPTIFSSNKDAENYYELKSQKTTGYTINTDNDWTNDYQTIEFYVRGYDLYNTSVNLELWLGDDATNAKGCVVVDNIEIEHVSTSEFSNATDKLELKSYSGTPSGFTNPYFNSTEYSDNDIEYPLTATGWTSTKEDEKYNESGVVYLGKDDEYKTMYSNKYDWYQIAPTSLDKITNNVYMMYNRKDSFQSLKSSSYNLASNSYYKISFDYYNQLLSNTKASKIKVEVVDENGIALFSKSEISSLGEWDTMEIFLHTNEYVAHNINVVVHLGEDEEDKKVGGYVYLDNFNIETSNETTFASNHNKTDLAGYFLDLNTTLSKEMTSTPAYTFTVDEVYDKGYQGSEAGAEGGIVNGRENYYGISTDKSDMLVLSTNIASKATLTSKFNFALAESSYYKLTFDLSTMINKKSSLDEHDCAYGVSIKLNGFEVVKDIVNDGKITPYTIYIKCDTKTDANLSFSLVSDCSETLGMAFLSNINIAPSNLDEYSSANLLPEYQTSVFTTKQTADEEKDPEEDNYSPSEEATNDDSKWLLIPSIIMGVALIIGIVGFALRKIKIKKIEKIKTENYDRKLSLDQDIVKAEAKKRRDEEVKNLQNARNVLKQEKERLEFEHKEYVRESRASSNGKLTREMEKAFKKYNSNISRLNEKINILKEKIDNVMTAEYLLSLEHKIVIEEENKFSKEKKSLKKAENISE